MTPQVVSGRANALGWLTLALLTFAYAVAMIDRVVLTLLVEPIKRDLAISDTEFGFLQGFAFAAFYAIAGLPLARLADNSSRSRLIGWGIAVWSLMTALCAVARSYFQLVLCRIGVGVGEAALTPAAISILCDLFPRHQRTRAIAIYASGGTIGSGLAYLLGGAMLRAFPGEQAVAVPLLGEIHGWQLIFLVLGLPGLALALVIGLLLVEPRRIAQPDRAEDAGVRHALWPFLRERAGVIGPLLGGFSLLYIVTYGYISWLPAMFIRGHRLDATTVGLALGVANMIAGVGGNFAGGWLCDRLVARGSRDAEIRIGLYSAGVLLPLCIVLPLVGSAWLALAATAALIFTSHFWTSSATAAVQTITPPHLRGQLTSIYILCTNLVGFGLGPVVVGAVTDHVFRDAAKVGFSLVLVAAVVLPAVLLLLATARRRFTAGGAPAS